MGSDGSPILRIIGRRPTVGFSDAESLEKVAVGRNVFIARIQWLFA